MSPMGFVRVGRAVHRFSSLVRFGEIAGDSGSCSGKNDVIIGRLDPEGDRRDWGRADRDIGNFPRALALSKSFWPGECTSRSVTGVGGSDHWLAALSGSTEEVELDCHSSALLPREEV